MLAVEQQADAIRTWLSVSKTGRTQQRKREREMLKFRGKDGKMRRVRDRKSTAENEGWR